jgi:hypothetical protein
LGLFGNPVVAPWQTGGGEHFSKLNQRELMKVFSSCVPCPGG